MKIKVYTLNAFAAEPHGGNPAGVVLDADNLSEEEMLKIAKKVGFSETAFVSKSEKADFRVRFFTPTIEIDLCGHATIATFFLLYKKGIISEGIYTQETKVGILDVEVGLNGKVLMTQQNPKYFKVLDKQEIADSLDISINEIVDNLPIEQVSTGWINTFIPLKRLETLLSLELNYKKVAPFTKKYGGYHLFSLETKFDSTAHCRNIAPHNGIAEESATGTANGALGCYLFKHGKISEKQAKNIIVEQGYCMNLPSKILVSLSVKNNKITDVKVGGKALNIQEKEIII